MYDVEIVFIGSNKTQKYVGIKEYNFNNGIFELVFENCNYYLSLSFIVSVKVVETND